MDNISAYRTLSDLLEKHTGQQLSDNRHWRVETTLLPIMRLHSIPDLTALAALLSSGVDDKLTAACVDAMINNETCFFRDQANFALLTGPLMDSMRAQRQHIKTLRIWSAACSTGQEAYSLAMSFAENPEKWRGWKIEIVATDVSETALNRAREGRYSQFEIQRGLPVLLMLNYFDQCGENWTVKDGLRQNIDFLKHNMLSPSRHLGQFDIILCRNMLMYLGEERRRLVLDSVSDCLAIDGMVMLGAAETVIGLSERLHSSREFRGFFARSDAHILSPAVSISKVA
jgi:chemotaxis protein methyltransferase CheR